MKYNFAKVTDYNLIAPALSVINFEESNIITTSKLINNLKINSIIPEDEKKILKNRSDDKFSQKIRNLISHKVLDGIKNGYYVSRNIGGSSYQTYDRSFYFFSWNKDQSGIYSELINIYKPFKILNGLKNEDFSSFSPNIAYD